MPEMSADYTTEEYVSDLIELVGWLALTYGDNDPAFPTEVGAHDNLLLSPSHARMRRTWLRVVRGIDPDDPGRSWAGTGAPGVPDGS